MSQTSKKDQPASNPSGEQLRMLPGSVPGVGSMGVPTTSTGPSLDLGDLRTIAEAPDVTAGPWFAFDRGIGYEVHHASGYELNNGHRETFTKPDATHIATFDPPTVLELIERAEAAERALDFHSQRDRELKMTLSMISDRLDEHSYDELSSLIEDEPLDQWGETYKTRLEQAEQQVQAVLRLADNWETGALRWEDPLRVPNEVFLLRKALQQPTHEPDWTDYQLGDPRASCSCGYNGPYKECWQSRRALDGDGRG